MLVNHFARFSKPIAWFFAFLFSAQFVLAARTVRGPAIRVTYDNVSTVTKLPEISNAPAANIPAANIPAAVEKAPIGTAELKSPAQKFTGGPTQPEMQSFQSVNVNNMVDLFSGDFSYNIPLLDVGGYPVSLHYQSGITMDQEASWVGLGWNIHPGSITRNMRGLPDDFKGQGDIVSKTLRVKENKTLGLAIGGNAELLGAPRGIVRTRTMGRPSTLGIEGGVFHNSYKGWGMEVGLSAGINSGSTAKGPLSGGLSITNNSQNGLDIRPSFSINLADKDSKWKGTAVTTSSNFNSRAGIQELQFTGQVRRQNNDAKKLRYNLGTGFTAAQTFSQPSFTPTISMPFTSKQFSFTGKVGSEHWAFHPNLYMKGYSSEQSIADEDTTQRLPAYGYLYYQKAKGDVDVLLDFNREKDVPYRNTTPHVAIPMYTYDTYSITGEGTGGTFRPYRGDVGYVYDHALSTKSSSDAGSLDYGVGTIFHGGVDINKIYATTKNFPWLSDNAIKDVTGFAERDTTFEEVYFKNPAEKTTVDQKYYDAIGDDKLIRVDLAPRDAENTENITAARSFTMFKNAEPVGQVPITDTLMRNKRSKRTQVISYLTADEAGISGLDKKIRSYPINSFPASNCSHVDSFPRALAYRKGHHLSELTVLNPDGRRYVYGHPVYNLQTKEVAFASEMGDQSTGLVDYQSRDNTTKNNRGKDGYFTKEEMPAYTHSFMLSGILSPDYVDLTGDGITDDDLGDAIKFNYSQVYAAKPMRNEDYGGYKWRVPYAKSGKEAFYNEGLKTDSGDDKGNYSYGEKEVWYLNSIESKTMIATFTLSADRKDGHGVKGENGVLDLNRNLFKLKEINLYSKADFLKNGSNAKPIKTVVFDYTYELCMGNPSSIDSGKLTLKRVWFKYNNNDKGKVNPYEFTYHSTNPSYNNKQVDRWGNYKESKDNPGATGQELSNSDYAYSLQKGVKNWDSTKAAANVAAWTLSSIKLPSGGKIDVTYESDDYAYVQDRRAMQMFDIVGFGNSENATPSNNMYKPLETDTKKDYRYVFINVPEQVNTPGEIRDKYLEGVTKLYFRLFVKMPKVPGDRWATGSDYEYVPCYADIINYGVKGNPADKKIWVQVAEVEEESPFALAAIQFLRLNLPSKAYPYSEPGDKVGIKDVLGMLATVVNNIDNSIKGFSASTRGRNVCNSILPSKSFVRLNNPYYKKFGGGLRVKRVKMYDNWKKMTADQQTEATYGVEYNYTTVKDIRGVRTVISSGVATYEPIVGNDENPFRLPVDYVDKVGVLAPTDNLYTEEPFGETFFPSPSVGYSKVTVRSINNDKKSATGQDVTEFYTAKDFPVITEFTALDNKSKKTFNPELANFFKFNAKHYVTLSQGFKVELNDMHGKLKSQSSYAQTDLEKPISYTLNYYKLQDDNTSKKRLSNTVAVADSANGVINPEGQLGKDVEIMMDVREQKSFTINGSIELNIDWVNAVPPITLGAFIPLPMSETNRFRSIAVLKIVNRYAILDSVVHFEKGSKVSTRNAIYDGETGEVLLSQTNNEFDDPVYNFNYPAHWAYSGMGPAYKNIGAVFSNVQFRQGKMVYADGVTEYPVERFFESGDELLVYSKSIRNEHTDDVCSPLYYDFTNEKIYSSVWAIDASKAKEGDLGIYFIDRNGKPFSAVEADVKIIRSGKRNMSSVPVGTITSLASPVKTVNNQLRFVFDANTNVIAAAASGFKDLWKVDSTNYRKDTTMLGVVKAEIHPAELRAEDYLSIAQQGPKKQKMDMLEETDSEVFEASSWDHGVGQDGYQRKTWLLFNFSKIPQGAVITSAELSLPQDAARLQRNQRTSNSAYIKRVIGPWVKNSLDASTWWREDMMYEYFEEVRLGRVDEITKVQIPQTTPHFPELLSPDPYKVNVTAMAQKMLDEYYGSRGNIPPSMMIRLVDPAGQTGNPSDIVWSRMGFRFKQLGEVVYSPTINVEYCLPCANGMPPVYSSLPQPGYYCSQVPKDTFVCKPNINDTAVNPYRWGILGNWRMEKAYTYYDRRMQSDPGQATNIRTDGAIQNFAPYWQFTDSVLHASDDSSRWVWNSELVFVNRKGFEIENRDPLGRHNSGQYGYNQTLPVAVAQNSKAREMFFEGFEDFDYKNDGCKQCQDIRFTDIGVNGNKVTTEAHTGKYSLRLAGNQTLSSQLQIGTVYDDTLSHNVSFKIDSTPIISTVVNGIGTGLKTEFNHYGGSTTWIAMPNSNIDIDWEKESPVAGNAKDWFRVRWTGYIQPRHSGVYTFYAKYDDRIEIVIDGKNLTPNPPRHEWEEFYATPTITLEAGKLYPIKVELTEVTGSAEARLQWESNEQVREIVPLQQLYRDPTGVYDATVQTETTYCVKANNAKPLNITLKRFSPLQGSKMVVGAWVKQEGLCTTGNYDQVSMELEFDNGTPATYTFKPKGNIIEGWQRIEDTVTIPANATRVTVRMKSTSANAVYFDDVRVHPYNSNMKSFVYNPINIRLMAELDENNYATFYEYDDDGTLIRVKKETERGIKTIRETRSALNKIQ